MDEHIVTSEGRNYRLNGEHADDSLNTMYCLLIDVEIARMKRGR